MQEKTRCDWCLKDQTYKDYHDQEWGVPEHNDARLFELLNLEGAQAGLSWYTVLTKRENYRTVFDQWDAEKIVTYNAAKVEQLLLNPGIIRNRLKIQGVITNAQVYLNIRERYGSFDHYIWQFTNYQTLTNYWQQMAEVPAKTEVSDQMSKALKKEGFKFVGSTICYAFMQAVGMVDDHLAYCWRRNS
ncbi:MAG: DNA-3-methyladenine glycosylase I [Bacteroidia bacterium]|nr:DNA-3-methyladenine glycosylase I [Bacteroidia bacterium]